MIKTATHSMMCLICNRVVKTVKGDNAKQHFLRHELCEDFLSMETLGTRTCGDHIFIAVKNAFTCSKLDLKYLRGICTDGASAMTGD